jgi:hypothetical protein
VASRRRAGEPTTATKTTATSTVAKAPSAGVPAVASTETPLDYMLRIMRDPAQDDDRRDAMAKAALPYIHARLTSIDGQVADNEGGTITFTWQPAQK